MVAHRDNRSGPRRLLLLSWRRRARNCGHLVVLRVVYIVIAYEMAGLMRSLTPFVFSEDGTSDGWCDSASSSCGFRTPPEGREYSLNHSRDIIRSGDLLRELRPAMGVAALLSAHVLP